MTEDVLQYIWHTQSFSKSDLKTTEGIGLSVIKQGILNFDSGPDFSSAKINIDGIEWIGDVEIHTKSSLWDIHNHDEDEAYNKVILHVVWEDDKSIYRKDGSPIPTVELRDYLSKDWLDRYKLLMSAVNIIPCESYLSAGIDRIIVQDAINDALIHRLERKSNEILKTLENCHGDWDRAAFIVLFENLGLSNNKEAFRNLASIIDFKVLRKLNSLLQIEAYLFGLAGLIPTKTDSEYVEKLKDEYNWIQHKFSLTKNSMSATWWKFMRMRPASFPTLRIAQLAAFIGVSESIAQLFLEHKSTEHSSFFDIHQSEFWQTHYHFNKSTERSMTGIGTETRRLLLINVVSPFLVAYGQYYDDSSYLKKAIEILENLKPESNKILRKWNELGIEPRNAAESQGLIELFNNYCKKSRCLSCSIGQHLLKAE